MRKQHYPSTEVYHKLLTQGGSGSLPGFHGASVQRGYGLGSMFRSLFRSVVPIFKSRGKALGKTALDTGIGVAKDVLAGKDLREAVLSRAKDGGNQLKGQAVAAVKDAITHQSGQGRKRK